MGPLLDDFEWIVVGGLAVTAFVLGYLGFEDQPAPGEAPSTLDHLYRSLQLFVLEYGSTSEPSSWELDMARVLAPAVTVYTATRALAAIFRERVQLLRLRFTRKKRVVICGLGRKGLLLARSFKARGYHAAVIEQDEDNDRTKGCREQGIAVLIGDATDPAMLRKARVQRATFLISLCGQDGTNADVAAHAQELLSDERRRSGALTAFVHVVDLELCRLLRDRVAAAGERDSFRLELFNVFESGARAWLSEHPPFGEAGEERDGRPHLLVVGVGQMGRSLIVGAAREWLTLHAGSDRRPRITIVDREALRKMESLRLRYPQLEQVCELVPAQTDTTWPDFERGKFLLDAEGRCDVTTIYVCLDDDVRGFAAALALLERVREHGVTIVVRTAEDAGLAAAVPGKSGAKDGFELLRAFPVLDRTCTPELLLGETTTEILARAAHEDYVRRETEKGEDRKTNPSLVDWHELPEGLRESNRRQADHVAVKLRAVGRGIAPLADPDAEPIELSAEEVELLAELEHERWMAERVFEGWTHAPPPKDVARKTSPDLVPWHELPEAEKEKDRGTVRGLPALLATAGLGVFRHEGAQARGSRMSSH